MTKTFHSYLAPLPRLDQIYIPKPGDVSLSKIRAQIRHEGFQTLERSAGPRVCKIGPYAVKLEQGASSGMYRVTVNPDENESPPPLRDVWGHNGQGDRSMAHEPKYKADDNLSLPPTENLAREGELLERARPYAVAVIGRVFALNEENRQPFCVGLVLERGKPLDTLLHTDGYTSMAQKNTLAVKMILLILKLHKERKMVHGDIKPSNVVMTDGELKLIDFDSGLPVDEKMEEEEEEEWQMKGTPMYESPNRHHGTHEYKAPVVEMDDLYALALTVYQIYVPGQPFDFEASGGMFGPNPILEKRGFPDLSKPSCIDHFPYILSSLSPEVVSNYREHLHHFNHSPPCLIISPGYFKDSVGKMATNQLVNEKFCPELAPHADLYAASYVVALIEPPSTEVPDEYQASRANAIILHSINSILPYSQLFKMSSSDAVAINVYILGNKTVVTVANNPNVTGKSFTESANAFKRNRIVCSIRRIQELLTSISGSGTNAAEARTTFSALPVSPIFKADDFSDHERAIFASLIRSHTGFHKRVDNDGEFVEAWLAECQRRLIEFGGGSRATETESTRILGQGLGAMTLEDLPVKGKENRQGLCMEANLSQQEGADTTME
ncbi:serine/threonine protein kinase [Orbilia oligospora]|uniref:Serine/threonine protein kinase n=1 Tax=Orbilia oligospora TaxID=2813651 RepID=A0A7C8VMK6_ORBOL|nr:serine/threonine protein kinase [Orbilia oligospora]